MAEFELDELIDLRSFAGYAQPVGDAPLSAPQALLEQQLSVLDADYAEAVRNSFLTPLRAMQQALNASYAKMGYAEIDDAYKRNSNELSERNELMTQLRLGLCSFLNVPVGPNLEPAPNFTLGRMVR